LEYSDYYRYFLFQEYVITILLAFWRFERLAVMEKKILEIKNMAFKVGEDDIKIYCKMR